GRDAHHHRDQEPRAHLRRDESRVEGNRAQDVAELADLPESDRQLKRSGAQPAEPGHDPHHEHLAHDDHRQEGHEPRQSLGQSVRVDDGSERDEEHHSEKVAEWQETLTRLGSYGTFGDSEASDEGGQRERDAEVTRPDACQQQAAGDGHEQEQIVLRLQPPQEPGQQESRHRRLLLLAPLQVAVTWILSAAACIALGMPSAGAALIGLSIAMSSSVVVVNITRSRRRTTNRITDEELLGWSVIQDLVGVSAALVLVVVLGIGGRSGLVAVGGVIAFVVLAAVAAFLLPWLLRRLQAEHDLFLLVSVASGLLLAGVGSRYFGIPLALAAFVAGLAITESPVAAEARQRLLPF